MKKKLAFSIAGATAAVIGGWKLVQQLVDSGDDIHPAPAAPAPRATPAAPTPAAPTPAAPEPAAGPDTTVSEASPEPADSDVPDKETSKSELYDMATELGIKGRSKMSKKELRKAIRDAS